MLYLVSGVHGEYSDAVTINYAIYGSMIVAEHYMAYLEKRYPDASFGIEGFEIETDFMEPVQTTYVKYNISLDTQKCTFEVRKQFHTRYGTENLPSVISFDHKTIFNSYFSHVLSGTVLSHQEVNVLQTDWLLDDGTLTDPVPSFDLAEFQKFKDDNNNYHYFCGNPKNGKMLSSFERFDKKKEIFLVKNKLYEAFDLENDFKFTFEITDIQILTRIAKKSGKPVISYNYIFNNPLANVFNNQTSGYLIREI